MRPMVQRGKSGAKFPREILDTYMLAREIENSGGCDIWEDEGGRRREYLDVHSVLHRALGLKLWEASPLDAVTPESPADPKDAWTQSWSLARELRAELEAQIAR